MSAGAPDENGDPFWAFSVQLYGIPGVAEAALRLQDGAGADVDVVLYILWRAHCGYRLDAGAIARVDAAVTEWREQVVRPLRAVRRALKTAPEAQDLRRRVQADELEAERLQHAMMRAHATAFPGTADPAADAATAMHAYALLLGRKFPDAAVAVLTRACAASA